MTERKFGEAEYTRRVTMPTGTQYDYEVVRIMIPVENEADYDEKIKLAREIVERNTTAALTHKG